MIDPKKIYNAYPNSDLLSVEPPADSETLRDFSRRVNRVDEDILFMFIVREADDDANYDLTEAEFVARLDNAIHDLKAVRNAFYVPV
jgi:hypothetical protein